MNTAIFVNTVTDENSGNSVNVYLTENAARVSPAVLRSLSLAAPPCGIIATAACSVTGGVATAYSHTVRYTDSAPLIVAAAIRTLTRADCIILDGAIRCFSDTAIEPSPADRTLFVPDP